ncbi:sugar transferase [Cellulomonas sp. SG140]|uniref:sugar transferase n=1 Tax=Cellulomonas sp. SG140 TaxID=2976536 RepID=UPI0021E98C12|nr:sugar transferase [Cellulomonas sp. SG140]
MTDLRDFTVTTAELAALTERRRAAAGPRRSWASTQPFLAGEQVALEGAEAESWRPASARYTRRAVLLDLGLTLACATWAVVLAQLEVPALPAVGAAVVAFLGTVALGHGYDRTAVGDGPREFQAILWAGLAAVVVPALAGAFVGVAFPRLLVLVLAALLTTSVSVGRYVLRRWLHGNRRDGLAMARTLVVGDAASVHQAITDLRASTHHGYRVVGICLPSVTDEPPQDGVRVLGALADVPQVAYDHRIETVVVAGAVLTGDALRRLSWALGRTGADLVVAPGLVEVLGPRVSVRPTAGLSLLEVQTVAPRRRLLVKSLLDRLLGTGLLIAAAPLIAFAALGVRLSSPGPLFFRQERVGIDGRPFTMVKLRSMYVDAEERKAALLDRSDRDGLMFKMHDDPRVTPVGRVLRRFSIDELPQLWNVARGDMSLVGPRPPLPEEVNAYQDAVFRRLHVRPGLTGLWQVSGRSDLSWDESVRLDLRYVDNWSVAMDLLILWKTGRAVLGSAGAY